MPTKPQHPQQKHRPSVTFCTECDYLRKERAGMLIDNGLDQKTADQKTKNECCIEHQPKPKQNEFELA